MLKHVICLVAVGLVSAGPAHGYVKAARDAGKDARGTDELKQECVSQGGVYLTTNGVCLNV